MSDEIFPVAVIGGGAAGVMATLRSVLNNDKTLFFPGARNEKKKSRAQWVFKVENIPGFTEYKKGIDDPNKIAIKFMEESPFSKKFVHKKNKSIVKIKKIKELFELTDSDGDTFVVKYVILCTGVMDVQPVINGEIKEILPFANAQYVDYCLRCDGHKTINKHTSIIGSDNGAAWVAVMLYERYQNPSMTIITHDKKSSITGDVLDLVKKYDIKIIEEEIVKVNYGEKKGVLDSFVFKNGEEFKSEFAFVSLGMIIYNDLAKQIGCKLDNRGFVVTDSKGESSIPGLFVAGDLRAGIKKQIYTAWDSSVDSADTINMRLRTEKRN